METRQEEIERSEEYLVTYLEKRTRFLRTPIWKERQEYYRGTAYKKIVDDLTKRFYKGEIRDFQINVMSLRPTINPAFL